MNFEEFLPKEAQEAESEVVVEAVEEFSQTEEEESIDDNIDVQKAVVESLAADKAAQAIVKAVADKKLPHQDNATIVIVEVE